MRTRRVATTRPIGARARARATGGHVSAGTEGTGPARRARIAAGPRVGCFTPVAPRARTPLSGRAARTPPAGGGRAPAGPVSGAPVATGACRPGLGSRLASGGGRRAPARGGAPSAGAGGASSGVSVGGAGSGGPTGGGGAGGPAAPTPTRTRRAAGSEDGTAGPLGGSGTGASVSCPRASRRAGGSGAPPTRPTPGTPGRAPWARGSGGGPTRARNAGFRLGRPISVTSGSTRFVGRAAGRSGRRTPTPTQSGTGVRMGRRHKSYV